jgi:uncharacterized protein (DUF302 family)
MKYYISKKVNGSFDEVVKSVTAALGDYGFGVLSSIRIDEKFKEKLGVVFRKYVILGACNPTYAHQALQREDKLGTLLPCNVIVQEFKNNQCEIAAIDPVVSMSMVKNTEVEKVAQMVKERLILALKEVN